MRNCQWITCQNRTQPCEHPVGESSDSLQKGFSDRTMRSFKEFLTGRALEVMSWIKYQRICARIINDAWLLTVVSSCRPSYSVASRVLISWTSCKKTRHVHLNIRFIRFVMASVEDLTLLLEEDKPQESASTWELFDSIWFLWSDS